MLRDEAVAEIKEDLAYRRTGDEEIVRALVRSQAVLEDASKTLPYFLRVNDQPLVTVVDQNYILLPDDFIKEVEEAPLYYVSATGNPVRYIRKADEKDLRAYFSDENGVLERGGVKTYTLLLDRIRVYPVPDDTYNLVWDYYAKDTSLATGNIENKWLKYNPDYLIGHAGFRLARRKKDQSAMQYFQGLFNQGQTQLIAANEERDWVNTPRILGGKRHGA